jgi:hypothetical protein
MVSPFPLENLGSSCLGPCREHFPPSPMNLALSQLATRSEHHHLVFCGIGEESITIRGSLHLDQLLVTGRFIELVVL